MLDINIQHFMPHEKDELFRHFESVRSLAERKPELGELSLRRDEEVLQIVDTTLRICPFFNYPARLRYTLIPGREAALIQIRGGLREYRCVYRFSETEGGTAVDVRMVVKFPIGPAWLPARLIAGPLMKRKLRIEFKKLALLLQA